MLQETIYIGRGSLGGARFLSPAFWLRAVGEDLRALRQGRHILFNLTRTQLTTRYHRSSLGFLWTLLHPMLLLGVQALVFSVVLKMNFRYLVVYIFAGLVAWQFFSATLDLASRSLLQHEQLLRKVPIPKFLCAMSDVLSGCINLVFASVAMFVLLGVVQVFLPADGVTPVPAGVGEGLALRPQLLLYPVAVVLLTGFVMGLSLIAMTLVTWFRDCEHIMTVVLQALYFAVPIVYPVTLVPAGAVWVMKLNPLYHYIALFHHAIVMPTWPSAETWLWSCGSTMVAMAAGYVTYKLFEDEYIYRL
jgi:ABC-2 type transport system permease protein/lipopolysaccharide transport system permease protein